VDLVCTRGVSQQVVFPPGRHRELHVGFETPPCRQFIRSFREEVYAMEIDGKKHVIIYLEDWQRRMVKDFLGVDCHSWDVSVGDASHAKYGVGPPDNPKLKKMYLTDWQIREIKEEAGEYCDYVELDKGIITDYGLSAERLRR
jgi:hypothetical protein